MLFFFHYGTKVFKKRYYDIMAKNVDEITIFIIYINWCFWRLCECGRLHPIKLSCLLCQSQLFKLNSYMLSVFSVFRLNIYFMLLRAWTPNSHTHTHTCNVNNLNTKITKLTQKIHWVAIISKRNEIAPSSSDSDMCVMWTNDDTKRLYWIGDKKIEENKSWSKNVLSVHFTVQLISSLEWLACVWHIAWISRQNLSILVTYINSFIRSRHWTFLGNVFFRLFIVSFLLCQNEEKNECHTLRHTHFI